MATMSEVDYRGLVGKKVEVKLKEEEGNVIVGHVWGYNQDLALLTLKDDDKHHIINLQNVKGVSRLSDGEIPAEDVYNEIENVPKIGKEEIQAIEVDNQTKWEEETKCDLYNNNVDY